MASVKRKLNELTIDKKKEVLDKLEKGNTTRFFAAEYGLSQKTISNIKQSRHTVMELWNANCSSERRRRMRQTEYGEIDILTYKFFEMCRSKNIPVNGPLLQSKSKIIADALGIQNFVGSNGWLESFLSRHNIVFRTMTGEANSMDQTAVEDWKRKLISICEGYELKNIFNADETGLFYKQLPSKTLAKKGEICAGGKLAKERLTCLFICSATGEKLIPLIIAKSAFPRAFKKAQITPKCLHVLWRANRKAWMTSDLFSEWLNLINRIMKAANRHILLFIDNAPSHPKITLSHVRLIFFPPNMTAGAQPLDQGIIQTIKLEYRRSLLTKLLSASEECKTATEFTASISVLDAVRWIRAAWNSLQESTISKCFARAGFQIYLTASSDPTVASRAEITLDEPMFNNNPFEEFVLPMESINWVETTDYTEYLTFDDKVEVHDTIESDADSILAHIIKEKSIYKEQPDSSDEDECDSTTLTQDDKSATLVSESPSVTYFQVQSKALLLIK